MTEEQTTTVINVIKAEQQSIEKLVNSEKETAEIFAKLISDFTEQMFSLDYLGWATFIAISCAAFAYFRQAHWAKKQVTEQNRQARAQERQADQQERHAIAYDKQAEAMVIQAEQLRVQNEKIEENNLQANFFNYVNLMKVENDGDEWRNGLYFLKTLAINSPIKFIEPTLHALSRIGASFSLDTNKVLQQYFVVEILHTIAELLELIAKNDTIRHPTNFKISGFNIIVGNGSFVAVFKNINFNNITFTNCNLIGVVFMMCNFYKTTFYHVKNISFKGCLLSGDNSPLPTNQFWNEKQFNTTLEAPNYIWDNDLENMRDKPQGFHPPLLADEYFSKWQDAPFNKKMDVIQSIPIDMAAKGAYYPKHETT